jgi:cell cycle arrest protein BUB2
MTFSACLPPLDNVVQLWDFLLSFGIHLNILCIVSILMKNRTIIMCSKSPIKVLRELVLGNAQGIINDTMGLIKKCPEDLYDLLVRHPYDVSVYDQLFSIDEW